MDQSNQNSVKGQVRWNSERSTLESNPIVPVQETAPEKGPLTGKDLSQEASERVRSARSSSRRSRKSDGAFRTISEVADILDVQQHVLRFWETKFSQVRPLKRGGGRRYYRPEDLELLKRIHHLLYTEGYTIKGVQKLLREQGKKAVIEAGQTDSKAPTAKPAQSDQTVQADAKIVRAGLSQSQRSLLEDTLSELKSLRGLISPE